MSFSQTCQQSGWLRKEERRFPADFVDDRRVEIRVDQRDQREKEGIPQIAQIAAEKGSKIIERAPGVSVEEIVAKTDGKLIVDGEIPVMVL